MKLRNQSGFSLVELMVVVAIIGVLASIAVPSVGKYMAKARQSEAKSNLASYYMSQKAFFAEYNSYYPRMGAIGYAPEGNLRYNVGTTAAAPGALAVGGYTEPTNKGTGFDDGNTLAYCARAGVGCTNIGGGPQAISAGAVVAAGTFIAGASGIIKAGGTADEWRINETKTVTQFRDGI